MAGQLAIGGLAHRIARACRLCLVTGAVCGLAAATAVAATLQNADAQVHEITIVEGDGERVIALKPGGQIDKICADGCVLRINGEPPEGWELEGPERVTIEDGLLFYDGLEKAEEPQDGSER